MPKIRRTAQEIEKLCDDAKDDQENLHGMTYQEGIAAACEWILDGYETERPIEEE